MQGSGACWPGFQGLGAEMLERRREPASHGTVKLRLRKPSNGLEVSGLRRKKLKTRLHGESGGIQAPGACGPGLHGGPQGLGPGPPGAWGLFPTKTTQTSQITIFRKPPGGSLAKAWVSAETAASEVGTWRETKPGYPPYPHPPAFWGCKGERKRVFTLSAFGNHPTPPPRSADFCFCRPAAVSTKSNFFPPPPSLFAPRRVYYQPISSFSH